MLVAGFLLGRPGQEALIPNVWIASLVGGNSVGANFLAALSGALMYFATLTEVPILQGLLADCDAHHETARATIHYIAHMAGNASDVTPRGHRRRSRRL